MGDINKIDSNQTGLRFAEEISLGTLDEAKYQIWEPFEPNSYQDFGGEISTVARNPINANRKRKKGVVTDINASGGFNTDITQTNLQKALQGFFFATLRRKVEETGFSAVTAVSKKYSIVGSDLSVGDLVFASGFTVTGNNGLKRVTAVDGTDVTVAETSFDETPDADAKLVQVGFQFGTGDAEIDASGTLPTLATTVKDMTDFGLVPGEFVFVGGDDTAEKFSVAADNGFCRVRSISDDGNTVTFDKTSGTMVTNNGAAKTIRIFFGRVLKDETGTNIVRRTYALERLLGANDDSDTTLQQAEYLRGSVANEFTMNVPTTDKVTCDLSFVSLSSFTMDENVDGANSLLSKAAVVAGSTDNAPEIVESDAFNTSSDVSRIKLCVVDATTSNPSPLFAFVQEMTVTINNNAEGNKAIGVTGSFEVSVGTFEVGGSMTAYFADVAAVQAVQDNADITLESHFVKANAGFSIDLPLITLGNGRPTVEQDKPIVLPLDNLAATGAKIDPNLNHTALLVFWDYLPDAAE